MTTLMKEVGEIFFKASSVASLESYQKIGRIPVAISALVKNKDKYELIPIESGMPDIPIRNGTPEMGFSLAQGALDLALRPLVQHIRNNKGASTVAFFLSVTAEGELRDIETEKIEVARVIVNAIRTEKNIGKTNVFRITKNGFVKITLPEDDVWEKDPGSDDLPSVAAQTILDMVWKEFIVAKNLSSIN